MKLKFLIPLALFVVLVGFLAVGLNRDPREIPSPLVNKPAPQFKLQQLIAADQSFSGEQMKGQVWMLNVWASWCVACREEHPRLLKFARMNVVPLVGLDYKDQRADGLKWLAQHGDPYTLSVQDTDGRVGINFGVYGVPETFIIDKQGIIRHKQIGPITDESLAKTILPLLEQLKNQS